MRIEEAIMRIPRAARIRRRRGRRRRRNEGYLGTGFEMCRMELHAKVRRVRDLIGIFVLTMDGEGV